jgi:hypothetical protein
MMCLVFAHTCAPHSTRSHDAEHRDGNQRTRHPDRVRTLAQAVNGDVAVEDHSVCRQREDPDLRNGANGAALRNRWERRRGEHLHAHQSAPKPSGPANSPGEAFVAQWSPQRSALILPPVSMAPIQTLAARAASASRSMHRLEKQRTYSLITLSCANSHRSSGVIRGHQGS